VLGPQPAAGGDDPPGHRDHCGQVVCAGGERAPQVAVAGEAVEAAGAVLARYRSGVAGPAAAGVVVPVGPYVAGGAGRACGVRPGGGHGQQPALAGDPEAADDPNRAVVPFGHAGTGSAAGSGAGSAAGAAGTGSCSGSGTTSMAGSSRPMRLMTLLQSGGGHSRRLPFAPARDAAGHIVHPFHALRIPAASGARRAGAAGRLPRAPLTAQVPHQLPAELRPVDLAARCRALWCVRRRGGEGPCRRCRPGRGAGRELGQGLLELVLRGAVAGQVTVG